MFFSIDTVCVSEIGSFYLYKRGQCLVFIHFYKSLHIAWNHEYMYVGTQIHASQLKKLISNAAKIKKEFQNLHKD